MEEEEKRLEEERLKAMDEFYGLYNRMRRTYDMKMHFRSDDEGALIEIRAGKDLICHVTSEGEGRCYELATDDLIRYEDLHPVYGKKIS